MTPAICIDFWAQFTQGWIQGRAKIGHVCPSSKEPLLQSLKATATNQMYSNYLNALENSVVILVPFRCLVLDTLWCRVLDLVISTYLLSNILMGQSV